MKYQAKAIGSGSEGAQTELQKEYHRVRSRDNMRYVHFTYPFLFLYTSP